MRIPTKLHNPFALIGQGFVVGALLCFAFQPGAGEASSGAPSSSSVSSSAVELDIRP